jgi:hypothetical protein
LSEVEKLDESKSSFEIEAGGVVCAVRGTGFEVEKQGDYIGTKTYHGAVEMQKDGQTQLVKENEHSTFNVKNASFLPKRHLTPADKKHYQSWVKTKNRVQKKRAARINGGIAPHRPHQKGLPPKTKSTGNHGSPEKLKAKQHAAHSANAQHHQARPSAKAKIRKPVQKKPPQRPAARQANKRNPPQKKQPRKNQQKKKKKNY